MGLDRYFRGKDYCEIEIGDSVQNKRSAVFRHKGWKVLVKDSNHKVLLGGRLEIDTCYLDSYFLGRGLLIKNRLKFRDLEKLYTPVR